MSSPEREFEPMKQTLPSDFFDLTATGGFSPPRFPISPSSVYSSSEESSDDSGSSPMSYSPRSGSSQEGIISHEELKKIRVYTPFETFAVENNIPWTRYRRNFDQNPNYLSRRMLVKRRGQWHYHFKTETEVVGFIPLCVPAKIFRPYMHHQDISTPNFSSDSDDF